MLKCGCSALWHHSACNRGSSPGRSPISSCPGGDGDASAPPGPSPSPICPESGTVTLPRPCPSPRFVGDGDAPSSPIQVPIQAGIGPGGVRRVRALSQGPPGVTPAASDTGRVLQRRRVEARSSESGTARAMVKGLSGMNSDSDSSGRVGPGPLTGRLALPVAQLAEVPLSAGGPGPGAAGESLDSEPVRALARPCQ